MHNFMGIVKYRKSETFARIAGLKQDAVTECDSFVKQLSLPPLGFSEIGGGRAEYPLLLI